MAQEKRHLTTEQLSTLLDGEVTAEEQAQWEAHLNTCPQCQQELAGLRQTVMLLHALPLPSLPRSFLLPVETAEPVAASQAASSPIPIKRAQRRTLNPYVRGVLRTMSALAAVIGVVFFLSGVLPALVMHGGANSSMVTSTGSSSAVGPRIESPGHATSLAPVKTPIAQNATNDRTPSPTATPAQVVQPQSPDNQSTYGGHQDASSSGPTFFLFDLSSPAFRVGLGMALVILGLMGVALFRRARRRTGL